MQKLPLSHQDWTSLRKVCLMVLVIFVGFKGVNAQSAEIEFKGIVLDSATNEPIAYAFIKVLDNIEGSTYSNENGEFSIELEVNHSKLDSFKVLVQSLCYEKFSLVLSVNTETKILLTPIAGCVLGGCKFPPFIIEKIKPIPFKGFGTKCLD